MIRAALILRFQLRFVRSDERPNLIRHVQQLQPLFFVQGHGKTSHALNRDCSLFAYFHTDTGRRPLFEGRVFIAEALEFSFQVFVGHGFFQFVC